MPSADQLLHNIKDHVEAALAILRDGKATGQARERLIAHIITEEADNRAALQAALATAPPERRGKLELAIEHSLMLVDILRGEEIALDLGIELLDHFLEEHEEGFLTQPQAASPTGLYLTVGSLLGLPQ